MSSLEYEVVHANGKYTGADGTEKTRWSKCGVVFKSDKGSLSMKLEYVPTLRNENGELWFNMFVPQAKEQRRPAAAPQQEGFRQAENPAPPDSDPNW